jgi:hypothetical protein
MRSVKIIGALLVASMVLSGCYGDRHGRPGSASDRHGGHHGGHHDGHDGDHDGRD